MKINRAEATNFLSWEKFEYNFIPEVIAISGDNKTQEDQGSNGSGKSGIQQIIYYATVGSNMRGVLDKKLIRKDCSEATTLVEYYCPMRDQLLLIERTIPVKGSSKLAITLNSEPVKFATVNDGNKFIVEWIGISAEDLKSYFVICKEFYKSFFKSSDTDKLALISRFINFSYIDKTKDIITSKIVELNASKQSLLREKANLEGKLEVYEANLLKEEARDFEVERKEAIDKLSYQVASIEGEILELNEADERDASEIETNQKGIEAFQETLKKAEKKFAELPTTVEFDETISEIKETLGLLSEEQGEVIQKQNDLHKKRTEIRMALQKININLGGAIKCPKCGHEFLTLKDTSIEEEKKRKLDLASKDTEILNEQEALSVQLKEYEETISEAIKIKQDTLEQRDAVNDKLIEAKNEIAKIKSSINFSNSQITSIQSRIANRLDIIQMKFGRIDSLKEEISEWKSKVFEKNTEEIEANMIEVSELIEAKEKKIAEIDSEVFSKEQWINRFKDFKRYMAVEQLKNIQNHANDLLKKQKSDLRLLLEGFKLDSKGNIKEGITPFVLREETESFWYYSGGERARVEIAVIMAFQTLINYTNPYGGLEFLFIDEITEGLSEEGLYNIIESLSFVKYPVLIITHVSNQNVKCKALKVEKVNNISRLV